MKVASVRIQDFKRFTDFSIVDLPSETKLVMLVGPNGSGKTSLFEAFNYWMVQVRQSVNFDPLYHLKTGGRAAQQWSEPFQRIQLRFHGADSDPRNNPDVARKLFYFRSAYRHEADFTVNSLSQSDDTLSDSRRPMTLISADSRVSDNYQRIVAAGVEDLFNPDKSDTTAGAIADRLIGRVRQGMRNIFDDLQLEGPGRPMQGGTFLFTKGRSRNFHYKNLSGGEKAAFDLLLDFVVKAEFFDDTAYCIDEPELHMHTRLQGRLLQELLRQLPSRCQLWISTHSIGMTRQAMAVQHSNPSEVAFLDFGERDFDVAQTISPSRVDRLFWQRMFAVALDDLSQLVAPREMVLCEGRRETSSQRRTPTFDAFVYRLIFSATHPDTEFIPLGGTSEIEKNGELVGAVISRLLPAVRMWSVYDRDDRSAVENSELQKEGKRVLGLRDLESYLWSDEIIVALAHSRAEQTISQRILAEKARLLSLLPGEQKPVDDIKAISGRLFNFIAREMHLVGCGNTAVEFAKATLAPLVVPGTQVFADLEAAVFPNEKQRHQQGQPHL